MLTRRAWTGAALAGAAGCGRSRRKTIGVVPKATSHLFFVSIHKGVDRAAQEFGLDVLWNGPNEETEHARQIQIVDAMVTRGVDALAISATDERALEAPVAKAIQRGIPVCVFDSGVNGSGFTSFIATDNYGAGRAAARTLAGLIAGKGTVAMVMHKPGGTSTMLREQGFEATIKSDFPNVRIVARQYGMSDEARSLAAAENILTAHPDLGGIFSSSEASSLGAVQALRSRGLGGNVRLVTFDTSKTHVQALREGIIDVMLVQDSVRIGYEAVKALAEKLKGGTPSERMHLPARSVVRPDLANPEIVALLEGTG
jgi:ribose transport system substrate-binding protein